MSAPTLLEHVGIAYDDPESLVASIGPRVADAVAAGDDVYLSVDRRTARGFRDWLGRAGDAVTYPSPTSWPQDIVRDMRTVTRPDRRTLVLGQYTSSGIDGTAMSQLEEGVNLVLGDLPLTLFCTCASGAASALSSSLRFGHPALWLDGQAVPNPDYREPASWRPVGGALWGPPTLRLDFRAPMDLHRLREHVTRAAESAGLRGETLREAVLAAHEAAVLASGGVDTTSLDLRPGGGLPGGGLTEAVPVDGGRTVPCVLEVRAESGFLHCEILGPRPEVETLGTRAVDPLQIVRMFCDRALLHDEADVRTVRVLRALEGAPSPAA